MKENQTEKDRNNDAGHPDGSNHPGGDDAHLLLKIQRQLVHLERKMDSILQMLQERQFRGNKHGDKVFRKDFSPNASHASGRFGGHGNEKRKEKSGNNDRDDAFYSRFRGPKGRSGSGASNKPFYPKPRKRK